MNRPAGLIRLIPERSEAVLTRKQIAVCAFLLLALVAAAVAPQLAAQRNGDASRDAWQRPEEVMDVLGVGAGSAVADVGCGEGYFVLRMARRVGPEGTVFAVDVDKGVLRRLRRRVEDEKLANVQIVQGRRDDPRLPAARRGGLDAVLIVNAYHEMKDFDAMLRSLHAALKPGGRLAIIDAPGDSSHSRADHQREHTIAEQLVRDDAARNGFQFRSKERDFDRPNSERNHWFFLVFEKPAEAFNAPPRATWPAWRIDTPTHSGY